MENKFKENQMRTLPYRLPIHPFVVGLLGRLPVSPTRRNLARPSYPFLVFPKHPKIKFFPVFGSFLVDFWFIFGLTNVKNDKKMTWGRGKINFPFFFLIFVHVILILDLCFS